MLDSRHARYTRLAATGRDSRIDFFRGLAIYMILVDHIEHNPFAKFTYHSVGLSDAAEIFIFLSGLSCGLAYPSLHRRNGLTGLGMALAKRSMVIYAYYVATSIATYAIVETYARDVRTLGFATRFADHAWPSWKAIVSIVTLSLQPPLPSVLILYIVLTVCLVPLFAARPAYAMSLLTISGLVWASVQLFPRHVPYFVSFPTFNPLAWQFLFSIGLCVGLRSRDQKIGSTRINGSPSLVSVAWLVVSAGAALRFSMYLVKHGYWSNEFVESYVRAADDMKYNLSAERLVHFLCVALLVGAHLPRTLRLDHAWSDALIAAGRNALPMFSASAVLSVIATIAIATHQLDFIEIAVLNLGMIVALWVIGSIMHQLPTPSQSQKSSGMH